MLSRRNQEDDWDPMRDDFNKNRTYAPQYGDLDSNDGVNLDFSRLYITNIPKSLNEDGIRGLFMKFGTLTEVFLNKDPKKRFGFVGFESPAIAKLAMTKLNRVEPLNLNLSIAHKKKAERSSDGQERRRDTGRYRDDTSSTPSGRSGNRLEDQANSTRDEMDFTADNEPALEGLTDTELDLELEQVKLEHIKLKEAKLVCRQRMLLIKKQAKVHTSSAGNNNNRCILPNGKVVVQNTVQRQPLPDQEGLDNDGNYAGAGDFLTMPALQSAASHACVTCGKPAGTYCSRCTVTPYCSPACQQIDWHKRHKSICHNLIHSLAIEKTANDLDVAESSVTPVKPLRTPRGVDKRSEHEPADTGKNNASGYTNKNSAASSVGNRQSSLVNRDRGRSFQRGGAHGAQHKGRDNGDDEIKNVQTEPATKRNKAEPVRDGRPGGGHRKFLPTKSHKDELSQAKPEPEAVADIELPKSQKTVDQTVKPPATTKDCTPVRKMIPKNCLIELLSIGDIVILTVDSIWGEGAGFVCLSLHEKYQEDFNVLCGDYVEDTKVDPNDFKPSPGDMFSYFIPEDGAWYRARCLSRTTAALIDYSKIITLKPNDQCKKLLDKYTTIPEFCCLLTADGVKLGENVRCTFVSSQSNSGGFTVSMVNVDTDSFLGEGVLSRWMPPVETVQPTPPPQTAPAAKPIPSVDRPCVSSGCVVALLDMQEAARAFVRPCELAAQRRFDAVLEDVAGYGATASPMSEPPVQGQLVISKYSDGIHYRALVKRTNVSKNKYLLEYIEYGNSEVSTLENLVECPPEFDLSSQPVVVSQVSLDGVTMTFTPQAKEYIDSIKENEDLILSLPNGVKTAPSGCAVTLTVSKNNENMNKKIIEMCTPDWKKIEERGGTALDFEKLLYEVDVEYSELPPKGVELVVTDVSGLMDGNISGYEKGSKVAEFVYNELDQMIKEYCNSKIGSEPYLPQLEEPCIVQCPISGAWVRGVMMSQVGGAGGAPQVMTLDRGDVVRVRAAAVRRAPPSLVRAAPALVNNIEIRGFPKDPNPAQLERAMEFMKMTDAHSKGALHVQCCENTETGFYMVDAPELIAAMLAE